MLVVVINDIIFEGNCNACDLEVIVLLLLFPENIALLKVTQYKLIVQM